MILSEIFTVDVKKDAWRRDVGMPPTTGFKKEESIYLGKKGNVEFYWSLPSPLLAFVGDEQVGYVLLHTIGRSVYALQAHSTAINPKYQGHNLAIEMYEMFLKNDKRHWLVSGEAQSAGGQEIWKRMASMPQFEVYVYDRETGEYETIDGDELEFDEKEVYADGPASVTTLGMFPDNPKKLLMARAK